MKLHIPLVFKVLFLVAVTFVGTLYYVFSHNLEQTKKGFMESEREKARIILQTLAPMVSITESFGFDSSIGEQIESMKKNNPAIISITIDKENTPPPPADDGNIVESLKIMDYFMPEMELATITIIYSNLHYEKLLQGYYEDIRLSAVIVTTVLLLLSFLLYFAFLPLKKLVTFVNAYDFTKSIIPIKPYKGHDEVSAIGNAIALLLRRMNHYTKEITDLNEHLQERVDEQTKELLEFNEHLQERVNEAVEKIRVQDAMMIKQARHAAMGEMIDNIAHQWKQPLNALSIIIQDIREAGHYGELDQEYLDSSVEKSSLQIQGMSRTIDDFKNFFRPEKKKDFFSLKGVLEYACSMIESTIRRSNIKIITEGEDCQVFGYKNELSQVIINILNNARDAYEERNIKDNAVIHLRIRPEGDKARLEIEDEAGGIPEPVIEKIFDPYFSTKGDEKGTGIGLYMSKTIIEESMDGKLEVNNGNKGALFSITMERPKRL